MVWAWLGHELDMDWMWLAPPVNIVIVYNETKDLIYLILQHVPAHVLPKLVPYPHPLQQRKKTSLTFFTYHNSTVCIQLI